MRLTSVVSPVLSRLVVTEARRGWWCDPARRWTRDWVTIRNVANGPIYHLALASDWEHSSSDGYSTSTLGRSLAEQGFIHCSFREQVQGTADLVYRDRSDVLLLEIDPARLAAVVRVERIDGTEDFPHVYGALNRDAVVRVTPIHLLDDGRLDIANAL